MENKNVVCPKCGEKVELGSDFCSKCGYSLKSEQENRNVLSSSKKDDKANLTTLYTCLGWVCAVLSLFLVPLLFGAGGVVFGYLLSTKKATKNRGIILIIFSVAFALLGMIIGAVVGYSGL